MSHEIPIKDFVEDLQRRGYTKYHSTREVMTEYGLTYNRAYYQVRKYWQTMRMKQDG